MYLLTVKEVDSLKGNKIQPSAGSWRALFTLTPLKAVASAAILTGGLLYFFFKALFSPHYFWSFVVALSLFAVPFDCGAHPAGQIEAETLGTMGSGSDPDGYIGNKIHLTALLSADLPVLLSKRSSSISCRDWNSTCCRPCDLWFLHSGSIYRWIPLVTWVCLAGERE